MRTKIALSAVVTAALAFGAADAYAQGSITQDPGRAAPGNLATGRLGPSIPSPATGGPAGTTAGNSLGNAPSTTETGAGTTVFHGTPRGYGSSSASGPGQPASPPSRAGSP